MRKHVRLIIKIINGNNININNNNNNNDDNVIIMIMIMMMMMMIMLFYSAYAMKYSKLLSIKKANKNKDL